MTTEPNFQKTKTWVDEQGVELPAARITKAEKLAEKTAERLYKQAAKINDALAAFKTAMIADCNGVKAAVYDENGQDPEKNKGNFTWYNFDRSLKIEVNISERIDFDETLIQLCQNKLNEFLDNNVESKDGFVKQFVIDAFSKSRGGLDAKKVMNLLKYRSKVNSPLFTEALDLLEKSIRHPDSKRYFRISVRNSEGAYENVDLNFSNI